MSKFAIGAGEQSALLSWILRWADRYRWALFGAIAVFYAIGFTGQWRIGPDSAQHLIFARSLSEHQDLAQTELIHGALSPGLAYLLAGVSNLFGSTSFVAANFLMLLLGGLALGLSYWLFDLYAGRPTAVLLLCMLSVAEGFYRYCFHLLPDLPFMVGAVLCLVGYERLEQARPQRWASILLLGTGIVVMALFRSVVLTFVAALILTVIWQLARRQRWWRLGIVGVAIVALVLVVRYFDPRNGNLMQLSSDEHMLLLRITDQLPDTLQQMFTVNLPHLLLEATSEQVFGVDLDPASSLLLSILVLVWAVLLIRVRVLWGLLIIIFIAQWSVVLVVDRYFLPLMPLLVIAWWRGSVWFEQRLGRRWGSFVFIGAAIFWSVPNVIRVGDFLIEQHQRPFIEYFEEGKYLPYYAAADWIRTNTPEDAVILADPKRCSEMSYLSDRLVIGYLYAQAGTATHLYIIEPAHAVIYEQLEAKGWHLGDMMAEIHTNKPAQVWTIRQVLRPKAINKDDGMTANHFQGQTRSDRNLYHGYHERCAQFTYGS